MPSDARVFVEMLKREKAEPLQTYQAWRPAEIKTPGDYVRRGVWLWWRGFVDSIRETWREAHRATYGYCSHPVGMRKWIAWLAVMECGCCGRKCEERDLALGRERWYMDGERDEASGCFKPRVYEDEQRN